MRKDPRETERALLGIASDQAGYFTASQACSIGYSYRQQHFHRERGNWLLVDHGLFRLRDYPHTRYEDLIRWVLWTRDRASHIQGVVSHETAISVYDLGDLLPAKIHLTVPPRFRKKSPGPGIVLHKAYLDRSEVTRWEGVPITSPLRTVMDLARIPLDPERLSAVVRDALQTGLIPRKELLAVLSTRPDVKDTLTDVILQLDQEVTRNEYDLPSSIRQDAGQVKESEELPQTSLSIQSLLSELKSGLKALYGKQLKGVYLFGSYARGQADPESDLDVLVVLDDFQHYAHEVDRTGKLTAELSLKHGVSISNVFLRESEWLHDDTPFLSNVRDEVVPA
jgi:predicted nucleotidyltransferase